MPGAKNEEVEFRIANQEYDPAIPVDQVREHPENYNEPDIGSISGSIDRFGFYGVILVQRSTGYIIAGNGRYRTAKAKGATTLPGFWLDFTDDDSEAALAGDNRHARLASVDQAQLAKVLARQALRPGGLDGTGYDGEDLDQIIRSLELHPEEGGDDEDGKNGGGAGDGWKVLSFKVPPEAERAFYDLTDGSEEKDDTGRFLWLVKQQAGEP